MRWEAGTKAIGFESICIPSAWSTSVSSILSSGSVVLGGMASGGFDVDEVAALVAGVGVVAATERALGTDGTTTSVL